MSDITRMQKQKNFFRVSAEDFKKISGSPIAYWVSATFRSIFELPKVGDFLTSDGQVLTGSNDLFLRYVWEVPSNTVGKHGEWKLHHKGGDFRKWYGNVEWVVAWGEEVREFFRKDKTARIPRKELWDLEGITWSTITSSRPSFRKVLENESFNKAAPTLISANTELIPLVLGALNSKVASHVLGILNPTLNCLVQDVESIPIITENSTKAPVVAISEDCLRIATEDWHFSETSWGFKTAPFLAVSSDATPTLESSYTTWIHKNRETIAEMKCLEEENNRIFIEAYGLQDELTPDVPIEQITLTVNPAYRYGSKLTEEEQWTRFRLDTMQELISYAIGCMMGRYSLDEPGLIYAHSGNEGFDSNLYKKFSADDDGIVPITDQEWFADDATNRFREFIQVAWDEKHLQENLDFVAESLCFQNMKAKRDENSLDTIRRYLSTQFYKTHLQTYKKRPIYWLFSSGKQKAFECLVYLHRYNEGTLARMRTEYVTPLMGKYAAYASQLKQQKENATSTADANRFSKSLATLEKKQAELSEFDAKLKHYADMRIDLDLDDGVKVNYGKFGDLLAEVKAVTGQLPEKTK